MALEPVRPSRSCREPAIHPAAANVVGRRPATHPTIASPGMGVSPMVMAAGSIIGSFIGGRLLQLVPSPILLPLLAVILVISAVKVWRH